jgi:hypothetical protein
MLALSPSALIRPATGAPPDSKHFCDHPIDEYLHVSSV